jgi:zinc protease
VRYQLANGLTVIFERQRSAPVAAMQVWVKAGSADESPEEAGLAHLHEHMLFKGTGRRAMGEVAREVEALGGEINAWTSFDQTVYHLVLASAHFAQGLDILADAVRCSAFDAGELSREIEVVIEEIKRSSDQPSRRVSRSLFETAFLAHPYRLPVLGTEESVRSFTREKVLAFFGKHYTPDNMVVVLVGDVEEEAAKKEIERLFGGDWGRRRASIPERAAEPAQTGPRFALACEAVQESHLAVAFPAPKVSDDAIAALDVLAVVLGQGEGSRLNLGLKIEKALATEAYAYAYTPRDPGITVIGANASAENTREALRALFTEIRRLALHPLDEAELAVTKAIVEADAIYGKETVQGVARKLGFYETVAGSLEFEAAYYEKVSKLTVPQVHAAAARWLDLSKVTVAALFPTGAGLTEAELRALVDEAIASTPPPRSAKVTLPAQAKAASAASSPKVAAKRTTRSGIEHATLSSGARVLVRREPGVPLFGVRAVFPGGLRYEREETNGQTQLASRLLTRATKRRDAAGVAKAIDEMAGTLMGSAGRNSIGLRGEFLTRTFEPALRLLAECMLEPAFEAGEVDKERAALLQDIRSRDDSPSGAVFDQFTRTLYRVHPYRLDPIGEEKSVQALGPAQLHALHASTMHRSQLVMAIVGDVDPERTFALCDELFGRPDGASPAVPQVPVEPAMDAPRRSFRELQKAQAHLVYGFLGTTVAAPERHALDVLSSVLSGQGGRLFVELRDKRSLAYSVSSFSVEGTDPGYFGVYMGTSPEKVKGALRGIREQLDLVCQGPLPQADLDRAKRYLIGTHAIGLQKNSARAALIAYDEAYGVGADTYLRYQEQIEAVTADGVLQVARKLLVPARGALAILGPKAADVGMED